MTTQTQNKKFIITKKVAKHGSQSIFIIPRMLEQHLRPGMTAQLTIDIINDVEIKLELEDIK